MPCHEIRMIVRMAYTNTARELWLDEHRTHT